MRHIAVKLSFYRHVLRSKLRLVRRYPPNLVFYLAHYAKVLRTRQPDVDVVSYPKSGRTWLEQLLIEAVLAKHGPVTPPPATLLRLRDHLPMLPLVNFTHAGSSWESRILTDREMQRYGTRDARAGKVIFLYRDPRDVLVSAYYHAKFRTGMDTLEKDELIDSPVLGIAKIINFMNLWHDYVAAHPGRAIELTYEDLHHDPVDALERVVRFIGLDLEHGHLVRAVDACRFERMQERERTGGYDTPWLRPTDPTRVESFKVRSGTIGEHRRFFSPEQIERLDRQIARDLTFALPAAVTGDDAPGSGDAPAGQAPPLAVTANRNRQ